MQGTTYTNGDTRSALSAFLLEHLGHVVDNDVGPLIGHAAWIGERSDRALPASDDFQYVLNAALAGDAAPARELPARSLDH
jgi:hypothetical protein